MDAASGTTGGSNSNDGQIDMKGQIVRPLHFAALSAILVIGALLLAMGWSNRQSTARLQTVVRSVAHIQDLQATSLQMTQLLADDLTGTSRVTRDEVAKAATDIEQLLDPALNLHSESPDYFRKALAELRNASRPPRAATARSLGYFRNATYRETSAQAQQLSEILADSRAEGQLIFSVMLALPLMMLALFWLSHRRIFSPIDNLRRLLMRVAEGDIRPIELRGIDPMLRSLFQNYNRMAERLIELETEHRRRASVLESEVRSATAAVLEQQRALTRAERLAAVGELSAVVAHELRNPMAGVRMALDNLRVETADTDMSERVKLISAELERMTRLLNNLLQQSRVESEAPSTVPLAPMIDEVLQLVRYQCADNIALAKDVEGNLQVTAPPEALRQALLNLTLNAVQSIGPQGGAVEVGARADERGVVLTVSDNGAAFPDEVLSGGPRAFLSGRSEGIGLGLSIVRRFAREVGGELLLRNLAPAGAQAQLVLPVRRSNV